MTRAGKCNRRRGPRKEKNRFAMLQSLYAEVKRDKDAGHFRDAEEWVHLPKKRVQIQIVEENTTETWEQPLDAANAERTLSEFARVDTGGEVRHTAVANKCGPI